MVVSPLEKGFRLGLMLAATLALISIAVSLMWLPKLVGVMMGAAMVCA